MIRVAVTGASGFVGSALVRGLIRDDRRQVIAVSRSQHFGRDLGVLHLTIDDLSQLGTYDVSLAGVNVVVHCAARVHIMNDTAADPFTAFRKVNVDATLDLARSAARVGVKRFIFISSIKVNGESNVGGRPFTTFSKPHPIDPYGVSKLEAEQGLLALGTEMGMEVVIIRPVLVYGPGVKANFLSMMKWLEKGIPLPFGAIHNKRSLVALDNLVDLIMTCVDHPAAANQVFLVSDGEDLSTTELLRRMGEALGRPARLIPVPVSILENVACMLRKDSVSQRLCGSLQVDISKTRELLGWTPPISVDEALRKTARDYLERQTK